MSLWIAGVVEKRFSVEPERTIRVVHMLGVIGAALLFAAVATGVMAFGAFFVDQTLATLAVGDLAPRNIVAPQSPPETTYVSDVLTNERRQQAVDAVEEIFDLPDPAITRQQTGLARRILDFINNVRRDPYGTSEQKLSDLRQITDLDLDEGVLLNILNMEEERWRGVDDQITGVLERTQQQAIRAGDVQSAINRLPTQVSVGFSEQEAGVVVEIVGDLVRANTFLNPEETERVRQEIAENFDDVTRTFVAGQIVVEEGNIITEADFEALQKLGLLTISPSERRENLLRTTAQSFMVSVIVMVVIGLYIARFSPDLYEQPRFLLLCAGMYLLVLIGARIVGIERGELYIYPTAAMALLFVAIFGAEVAIISSLGLAMMVGFMVGQRLDIAAMVATGGLIGVLTLRRPERLNSYFFAGLMVSLTNIVLIVIFNLTDSQISLTQDAPLFPNLVAFGFINGLLAAAAAMALMYLVTIMFNLPTGLRLVELSQPNHPVLQRLLRDAPGTYQHSLQVANLAEQATSAISGNAELVRVAALYHDIGKSLNAPFFVENQADGLNPHDEMGDPYRSADIIISHVTEGEKLAKQNRLPGRIRDFIMEHHGTTRVEYFYRQALSDAEDPDTVEPMDFTYPGPIPQSRETAIMMLADSCESTVRARRPSSKQEIQEIVQGIIDARSRAGQLDEAGLTTNDIKTIRTVFVDMLQAVFHPRINYPSGSAPTPTKPAPPKPAPAVTGERTKTGETKKSSADSKPTRPGTLNKTAVHEALVAAVDPDEDDDVSPLPDVPPLPRKTSESNLVPQEQPETETETEKDD